MSDWDGPTPSDSGYTRRQMLAGGLAGIGAITLGGAYATGQFGDDRRTYSSFEDTVSGFDPVDIQAGTPVVAHAEIRGDYTETFEPDITVALFDPETDTTVFSATDTESVTTRETVEDRGTYWFRAETDYKFHATLKDQKTGLF